MLALARRASRRRHATEQPRRSAAAPRRSPSSDTVSGGSRRIVSGPGGVHHQPLLEQQRARQRRAPSGTSKASIRPRPRTLAGRARAGPPASRSPFARARAARKPSSSTTSSTACGRRRRPPARRRRSSRGRRAASTSACAGLGDAGADRQAAAEALGHRHHVGRTPSSCQAHSVPGAAHAALDLVEDQQRAVLVAGLARGREHLAVERVDAGLALDRLEQHGRGVARRRPPRAPSGSSRGTTLKPGTSGANGACLASCGVADSAPIVRPWKPPSSTTKSPPGAVPARELERALDRLGARVAEEHLAAERRSDSRSASRMRRLGVVEVADVHQPRRPARSPPPPAPGGSGRSAPPRCRRGSRGTRCPRRPTAACPRRARTRPGCARRWPSRPRAPSCLSSRGSGPQLGADALVGEQLEQQRVRLAAVDDVGVPDARRRARAGRPRASAACRRSRSAQRARAPRRRSPRRCGWPGRAGSARQPSTSVRNIDLVGAERRAPPPPRRRRR